MLKGGASLFPWSFCTSDETKTNFSGCRMYRIKEKQYFCVVEPLGWKKNKIFTQSEAYDCRKTKFSSFPTPWFYFPRPWFTRIFCLSPARPLDSVGFFWKNRQKGMILENKTSLVASAQHIQSVNIDVIELIESIAKNMNWKQGGNILRSIDLLIKIVLQNKDTFSSQIIDTISISIKICFIKYNKPNFHDTSVASIPENTIYDSYLFCLKCEIWLITLICFIYGGRLYLDDSSV